MGYTAAPSPCLYGLLNPGTKRVLVVGKQFRGKSGSCKTVGGHLGAARKRLQRDGQSLWEGGGGGGCNIPKGTALQPA